MGPEMMGSVITDTGDTLRNISFLLVHRRNGELRLGCVEFKVLEHLDGEAQQAIGHLEGICGTDFRAKVKCDHHVYKSAS